MNTSKIKTEAEVLEVSAEKHFARLKVEQKGCGNCSSVQGCLFKSLCRSEDFLVSLPQCFTLSVGDKVELAVEESTFFRLLSVAYLLPLLGFFAGIGGASILLPSLQREDETMLILFAFSGLLIGMLIAKMVAKRLATEKIEPKIVQVLPRD